MLFKELETDRLILRNISQEDRNFIFQQFSDDEINRYLFDAEPVIDIQGADEIINFYLQPEPRYQHRWIITKKDDDIKIGTCGFHCWNPEQGCCDVGYDLNPEYWGNGYMYEAMREILKFAIHDMKIMQINACIYPENEKSSQLIKKLGFLFNGKTESLLFRGKEYLHQIYSLDCNEFIKKYL